MRDFRQREPFFFREDFEDRFQGAVAARPVEAQLVAISASAVPPAR
jgi:hypothetical protein